MRSTSTFGLLLAVFAILVSASGCEKKSADNKSSDGKYATSESDKTAATTPSPDAKSATSDAGAKAANELSEDEARDIAVDAYVYGYPLVTMEMTRRVMTNVAAA